MRRDFISRFLLFSALVALFYINVTSSAFGEEDIAIVDGADMVLIPSGIYSVGDDARPTELGAFYIDRSEVTNAHYAEFLNSVAIGGDVPWEHWIDSQDGSKCMIKKAGDQFVPLEGFENYPVVTVSWEGAMAYAAWTNKELPTRAQWEASARGGSASRFPSGDAISPKDANYTDETKDKKTNPPRLMPSESFAPNAFGLYDVIGNAAEWTGDDYATDFLSFVPALFFKQAKTESAKILMGGSFLSLPNELGVSRTIPANPNARFGNVGFRCVRNIK